MLNNHPNLKPAETQEPKKPKKKLALWEELKSHRDIFNVTIIFVFWRLVIELFSILAENRFSFLSPGSPWNDRVTDLINSWSRWDSGWYLNIIENGYQWVDPAEGASNVAFFPLYPYLIKLFAFPLQSNAFATGIVISSLALLVGLIYFFKLVEYEYSRTTAYRALLYILIFPMSFFFAAVYTESLFFMISVMTVYYARRSQWLAASIFGFFGSLTRFVGVALFFVVLFEYIKQKKWRLHKIRADVGYAFFIPLGLFAYMYFLKVKFGNALLFFKAQEAWGRGLDWPHKIIAEDYWPLVTNLAAYGDPQQLELIMDFFYFTFAVVMLILCFIFLRRTYAWFALAAFIPSISSGTLDSIGRYTLVIFPFFMLLAVAGKWKPLHIGYTVLASLFLAYNIILFVNWNWVA